MWMWRSPLSCRRSPGGWFSPSRITTDSLMAGHRQGATATGLTVDAIVVAAGTSSRMGGPDKLLVPLGGRPLLARALEAVAASPVVGRIVLVMKPSPTLDALRPSLPSKVVAVVPGGDHRGSSVAAGLAALTSPDGAAAGPMRAGVGPDGAPPPGGPGSGGRRRRGDPRARGGNSRWPWGRFRPAPARRSPGRDGGQIGPRRGADPPGCASGPVARSVPPLPARRSGTVHRW